MRQGTALHVYCGGDPAVAASVCSSRPVPEAPPAGPPGPNAPAASRLAGAPGLQGSVVAPVEVTVTAANAVRRRAAWGGGEFAYVEVTLIGPFFEGGKAEAVSNAVKLSVCRIV